MQFLRSEVWSIAGWALAAGAIAGSYRAVDLHVQHRTNSNALSTDAEAIRAVSPYVYQHLSQLQEYQYVNKTTYIQIERFINRLCKLKYALDKPGRSFLPELKHLRSAELYYNRSSKLLMTFQMDALENSEVPEGAAVVVKKLTNIIDKEVAKIYNQIYQSIHRV